VKLSLFLTDLIQDGNVVVPRTITPLTEEDIAASLVLLRELYDRDVATMPGSAPAFDEEAASWAAGYIFYACQLILLRDVDDFTAYLYPFSGNRSAEAIYSVDLMLRFLPDLFRLGSGLAPDDPLVTNLRQTAIDWPYSSIGLKNIDTGIPEVILRHACLRIAYIDRVISYKDTGRLTGEAEKELLKEVMGDHQAQLWPGLELLNV
jgi:hypothetical protein